MITYKRAAELFHYDSLNGVLVRKIYICQNAKKGDVIDSPTATSNRVVVQADNKKYLAHQIIWLLVNKYFPSEIDHIDGNGTNNRIENLREVTHQENMRNLKLSKSNVSGVVGVSYYPPLKKWRARIKSMRKDIHIGYFVTKVEAVSARKEAEALHGFHINHGRQNDLPRLRNHPRLRP